MLTYYFHLKASLQLQKKTFKIFTWVTTDRSTDGLGIEIGTSSGAPSDRFEQYGVIRIEKLK